MDYILILKILALAWLISGFEPLQWLVELLPNNLFKYFIVVLTSCFKCCSMWVGFALGGIWYACAASFIAATYTKIKQRIDERN